MAKYASASNNGEDMDEDNKSESSELSDLSDHNNYYDDDVNDLDFD